MLSAQAIEVSGAGSGVSRVGVPSVELTVGVSSTAEACGETSIMFGAVSPSFRVPGPCRLSVVAIALSLIGDGDGDENLDRRSRLGAFVRAVLRRPIGRGREHAGDLVGERVNGRDGL